MLCQRANEIDEVPGREPLRIEVHRIFLEPLLPSAERFSMDAVRAHRKEIRMHEAPPMGPDQTPVSGPDDRLRRRGCRPAFSKDGRRGIVSHAGHERSLIPDHGIRLNPYHPIVPLEPPAL